MASISSCVSVFLSTFDSLTNSINFFFNFDWMISDSHCDWASKLYMYIYFLSISPANGAINQ